MSKTKTTGLLLAGIVGLTLSAAADEAAVERHVRYTLTVQNPRAEIVENVEIWASAPMLRTPWQACLRVDASHPHRVIADRWGNQVLHFTFNKLAPYATKVIAVEADLRMTGDASPGEGWTEADLGAEPLLDYKADAFRELAPDFSQVAGEQRAQEIHRWVRGHVREGAYGRKDRGATYALRKGTGDCTEFACLFAALCRRDGIPARVANGYVADRNAVLRPHAYHNWALFYDEGSWQIADPQENQFRVPGTSFVMFSVMNREPDVLEETPRFAVSDHRIKVMMSR